MPRRPGKFRIIRIEPFRSPQEFSAILIINSTILAILSGLFDTWHVLHMKTYYILNANNIILETGGDWDRFASENDGAAAMGDQVRGHSLWRFVQGDGVRSYLNAVLFSCRSQGRGLVLPLRCDSPFERRDLRMTVTPLPGQLLKVSHHQVITRPRNLTGAVWERGGCINCGGFWRGRGYHTVCVDCRRRAAAACDARRQPGDLAAKAASKIDFHDAMRLRRAALTQYDPLPSLRI